jgi:heat shock protein HslJ
MRHHEHRSLLPILCLLACGPELPAGLDSVEGRTFLSERVIEDGTPRELVAGTRLELRFHEAMSDTGDSSGSGDSSDTLDTDDMPDTWIGAYTGCNRWWGYYAIEGNALVVTGADHTLIGCDWQAQQEHWYFTFLESSPSLALDGHSLVLESGGARIEYLDEAAATPDLELAPHTWAVYSILEINDVVPLRPPRPATLTFTSDGIAHPGFTRGTVAFDTGCNTGSGSYHASDTSGLSFADLTLTQTVCDGDAARLESLVLRVLGTEHVYWEVAIDRLWLAGEGVALELVASND